MIYQAPHKIQRNILLHEIPITFNKNKLIASHLSLLSTISKTAHHAHKNPRKISFPLWKKSYCVSFVSYPDSGMVSRTVPSCICGGQFCTSCQSWRSGEPPRYWWCSDHGKPVDNKKTLSLEKHKTENNGDKLIRFQKITRRSFSRHSWVMM